MHKTRLKPSRKKDSLTAGLKPVAAFSCSNYNIRKQSDPGAGVIGRRGVRGWMGSERAQRIIITTSSFYLDTSDMQRPAEQDEAQTDYQWNSKMCQRAWT